MNDSLLYRIRPVARRLRVLRFWQLWAVFAIIAACTAWWLTSQAETGQVDGRNAAITLASIAGVTAFIAAVTCAFLYRDERWIAARIEEHFPSLDQRLLTALSQPDDQLGFMQQRIVKEARDHSRSHQWIDAVSGKTLWLTRLWGLSATAALAALLLILSATTPRTDSLEAANLAAIAEPVIQPGDTEIERGTSLVITAKFASTVFNQGELRIESESEPPRTLPMTQNLKDPILGGFLSSVEIPITYQVVTSQWTSRVYKVDVFEFPQLARANADLVFPKYTRMKPKRINDTVRVSAVAGTELNWELVLNKPVKSAELVDESGERTTVNFHDADSATGDVSMVVQTSERFNLELVDNEGRKNKYPPTLVIRALPNQPPKLKVKPASDSEVSPLEEFPVSVETVDDFGIDEVGLAYSLSGGKTSEIILRRDLGRGEKTSIEQMLALEDMGAEPDQLLAYHFFASDVDADGNPRRTESDMYFAEVRPFDQIFRQGDPPPGGEPSPPSPQEAQAEELAEIQKEIISATWRVIREHRTEKANAGFSEAIALLSESQTEAMTKLDELAGKVKDPQSQQFIGEIRSAMASALEIIDRSASKSDGRLLGDALPFEQEAYGGLLKLREREFEVSRSQKQPSKGQGSAAQQRKQEQLDDLELEQDENRYETQSQAQTATAEEAAEREVRQILNRLRDLARRQEDLNKELAQLQSALEQAETDEEREAIERQLERLREQEQDLLRETDELAERMQQPSEQATDPETQEKLQETRAQVQKSAEALEKKDVAEALASGKRAERQFEEMRDDFRKEAAGQFNDAIREMRNEAQQLDEQQQELTEKLDSETSPESTIGLRDEGAATDLEEELERQREAINELLDRMQETVTDAEEAEPLLAQKLYDSYRKTRQRGVERKMEAASELVRRGMNSEAKAATENAGEDVSQLREDLEEAAETVLGDETKALERALGELDRLDEALRKEIEEQAPQQQQSGGQRGGEDEPNKGDSGEGKPGESEPGESEPGGGKSGGEQPSQRSSSEGSPSGTEPGQGGAEPSGQPGEQPAEQPGQGGRPGSSEQPGGAMQGFGGQQAAASPLTGDGFREWSDSLREVEEMVDAPELRSQAAQIRDRAREIRTDLKRNSKEPEWDMVEELIATPLRELKRNVSEELMRRSAEKNADVPIDRDPVPTQFTDAVRRYYERLGSGQ
ncbi:hypothetical protein [Rubripirellula reticaptiva]|uniref:Uncharacterized protein n=1 Tax=Rubripirellula reticaptiva TaxID=2528013 RepID=A0A5C6EU94_9BACT|nr:hypothetical protein [Rubripirellula reticaptiva]TWU51176.1 hypothetical protein Poly59_27670 [Rubripirellula reticaptiva]